MAKHQKEILKHKSNNKQTKIHKHPRRIITFPFPLYSSQHNQHPPTLRNRLTPSSPTNNHIQINVIRSSNSTKISS